MVLAIPTTPLPGGELRQYGAAASRPIFETFVRISADTAYAAGGTGGLDAIVASAVEKENIEIMYVVNAVHGGATAGGIAPAAAEAVYNPVTSRLLLRSFITGTEATAGDLSALELRLWVVYR